jgi:YesN/AraC family two-component response regulator
MKVLIIDDDYIVARSCKRILEAEEMEIYVANTMETGAKLLEAESSAPFDLILTDIKMPGRDGFDMIHEAKKKYPDIPILMMTGYLTTETMEKGHRLGADNYIAKPFTPKELMEAIVKAINQQKGETK